MVNGSKSLISKQPPLTNQMKHTIARHYNSNNSISIDELVLKLSKDFKQAKDVKLKKKIQQQLYDCRRLRSGRKVIKSITGSIQASSVQQSVIGDQSIVGKDEEDKQVEMLPLLNENGTLQKFHLFKEQRPSDFQEFLREQGYDQDDIQNNECDAQTTQSEVQRGQQKMSFEIKSALGQKNRDSETVIRVLTDKLAKANRDLDESNATLSNYKSAYDQQTGEIQRLRALMIKNGIDPMEGSVHQFNARKYVVPTAVSLGIPSTVAQTNSFISYNGTDPGASISQVNVLQVPDVEMNQL